MQYGGRAPTTSSSWTSCCPKADGTSPWPSACAERMWARPILLLTARDAISDKICGYDPAPTTT